jgi:hypothetical protein
MNDDVEASDFSEDSTFLAPIAWRGGRHDTGD